MLAVTEYARDEAVSQGVPMVVWIDADTGHFGAKAMPGYEDSGARSKEFTLLEGLHFDTQENAGGAAALPGVAGETDAAEFTTDGTLDPSSQTSLRLVDRDNSAIEIAQTNDAWGYEIVKDTQ